jgi:hypothetical protein
VFKNCSSNDVGGGAGYLYNHEVIIINCKFIDCSSGEHTTSSIIDGGYFRNIES